MVMQEIVDYIDVIIAFVWQLVYCRKINGEDGNNMTCVSVCVVRKEPVKFLLCTDFIVI